jgi:hypothetical protein
MLTTCIVHIYLIFWKNAHHVSLEMTCKGSVWLHYHYQCMTSIQPLIVCHVMLVSWPHSDKGCCMLSKSTHMQVVLNVGLFILKRSMVTLCYYCIVI